MLFKGNSSRLEFLIEKIQAHKELSPSPLPDDKFTLRSKEGLMNGSYSWRSEDDSLNGQRGGGTPSSCTTSTSLSFPSETETDVDVKLNGIDSSSTSGLCPYPCQFCDKSFPSLSQLKKHEQTHGDQMPYRCSWCARLFKHKRSRDRHVKLHTGDRRYRCTQCEAAFSRSDHLKIHMKTHDNQKPYHCSECSRGYNTAAALTSHMQTHKRPQSLQLTNYPSKMSENERSSLWPSRGSSPSVSSPLPSSLHKLPPYSPDSSANESSPAVSFLRSSLTLACMYCTKDTFTSMEQLQLHVQAVHELAVSTLSPSSSPNKITDNNYKRRKKKDFNLKIKDELLSCVDSACAMKFTKLNLLNEHIRAHHSNNDKAPINNYDNDTSASATESAFTLSCPLCGLSCSSPAVYAEHYVLEHCENRRVIADKSSEKANYGKKISNDNSSNLSAGVFSSTTLLCGQCGAALKDFESFRVHLAHHLQVNNYQKQFSVNCPKCELIFTSQDEMVNHLTKHYLSDEKILKHQYWCDACDRHYLDIESLKKHTFEEHTQRLYRCSVCREIFETAVGIQVHLTVKHTRECAVYQCTDCVNNPGSTKGIETVGSDKNGIERDGVFKSFTELMKHVMNAHLSCSSSLALSLSSAKAQDRITQIKGRIGPAAPETTRACGELFLRCCFCGVHCNTEADLQRHLATHSTCLYRCPICRQGFTVEFLLDKHIAQIHNNNSPNAIAAVDTGIAATTPAGADTMIDCQNVFNHSKLHDEIRHKRKQLTPELSQQNPSEYKRLTQNRPNNNKNNNNLNDNDDNSNNNNNNDKLKINNCEYCDRKDFTSESELRAHKKLAHKLLIESVGNNLQHQLKSLSQNLESCSYCGESLRSRGELETHTRIYHSANELGKRRYKCNICDELFSTGGILAEHKLDKHCKIKLSDVCTVCRVILHSEVDFIEHVQKHSFEAIDSYQQRHETVASAPVSASTQAISVTNTATNTTLISNNSNACITATNTHVPVYCVVCRQTLISEFECQLHARYHLRSQSSVSITENNNSNSIRKELINNIINCCICLREFDNNNSVIPLSNNVTSNERQLNVCNRCYERHLNGLPILGNNFYNDNDCKVSENFDRRNVENYCKLKSIKLECVNEKDDNCNDDEDIDVDVGIDVNNEEQEEKYKGNEGENENENNHEREDDSIYNENKNKENKIGVRFENNSHEKNSAGVRPYNCPQCNLKFALKVELEHHLNAVHMNKNMSCMVNATSGRKNNSRKEEEGHSRDANIKDNASEDGLIVKEEIFDTEVEEGNCEKRVLMN
ncbi:zinc finger protein Lobe [Cotesia typhae]|uniref:zinc finger protein Lobe n=1 Tax=Cotesia typhae TaxID=2053667 RepID=UPI003D68B318